VLVGFVIRADGTVTSLSVLKSTEPLLNDFALQHVSGYLFQPAEVEFQGHVGIDAERDQLLTPVDAVFESPAARTTSLYGSANQHLSLYHSRNRD
jgi:hypothetical protein